MGNITLIQLIMCRTVLQLLLTVLLMQCCRAQSTSGERCNITKSPIQLEGGTNVTELNETCIAGFKPRVETVDLSNCSKVFNASRDLAEAMIWHTEFKQLHDQSKENEKSTLLRFFHWGECPGSDQMELHYNTLNTTLQELGAECKLVEVTQQEEMTESVNWNFDWLKDIPSFLLTMVGTMVSYLLTSKLIWFIIAVVVFAFAYSATLWSIYIAWRIARYFNWFGHKDCKAVSAKELRKTDARMLLFICHRILDATDITVIKLTMTDNRNDHSHCLSFTWTRSEYKNPTSQLFHMLQAEFRTVYTVYCVCPLLLQLYYVLPLMKCLLTVVY